MSGATTFIIRPHRGGWQSVEAPGVEPYFVGEGAKEQAIAYALNCRTAHRHGEIRVVDKDGNVTETISLDGRSSKQRV